VVAANHPFLVYEGFKVALKDLNGGVECIMRWYKAGARKAQLGNEKIDHTQETCIVAFILVSLSLIHVHSLACFVSVCET
jgi:hypothetical protein